MFLMPIGHEHDSTRRLPWVTFGVMILCTLAFVATGFGGSRTEWDAIDAHERAATYWMDHPYLRLDPRVEQAMHGLQTGAKKEAFREGLRTMNPEPEDAALLADEQRELDRLCEAALNEAPDSPLVRWGLVPANFSFVALFTHMFLHAGWLHIIGNLFFLFLTGPFIEDVWGRPVYAAFYLASGIVAALAFAIPHADLREPMIGASGAIAGVMGAFAVRYWSTKIRFFYVVGIGMVRGTFWAPAWLMLGLWFAQQLVMAALTSGGGDTPAGGVAYLAHAGGFAFGAVVALGFKRGKVEERWIAAKVEAAANRVVVANTAVEEALRMAEAGNNEGAWERLTDELRANPGNHDAALALWSVGAASGRAKDAAPVLARLIQDEVRRGELDLALDHWDELRRASATASLEPRVLLKIAGALRARGHRKEATEALRRLMLVAGKMADASFAAKIAETAADLDPALATAAARLALARPDLDPVVRAKAEAVLAGR